MKKLSLLFTKDGLQWQIKQNGVVLDEEAHFVSEDGFLNFVEEKLEVILQRKTAEKIEVISALNHFTVMPEGFSNHEAGYELIAYNAPVDKEKEELMLSVNKKFGVQFYYTFPKYFYERIKSQNLPTHFNFSGEKFLNSLKSKAKKEIHINLYHHQVEFFALNENKVILYNNLDANSEVDFLYFILFTLNKIDFDIQETHFYLYGEMKENETFISELKKFVPKLEIIAENSSNNNFILN